MRRKIFSKDVLEEATRLLCKAEINGMMGNKSEFRAAGELCTVFVTPVQHHMVSPSKMEEYFRNYCSKNAIYTGRGNFCAVVHIDVSFNIDVCDEIDWKKIKLWVVPDSAKFGATSKHTKVEFSGGPAGARALIAPLATTWVFYLVSSVPPADEG